MPELPQMKALSERLTNALADHQLESYRVFGFSGLKTADPPPEAVLNTPISSITTRGKYLVFTFTSGYRILLHLSQAGRLDIEHPPKDTKPKGVVTRFVFNNSNDQTGLLLREYGTERKAGWWVLKPNDNGPLDRLGPEADSDDFAEFIRASTDGRRVHTILRDQKTVAGVGRGYSDDALHRAKLSPYVSLKSMKTNEREALIGAIKEVLGEALEKERQRTGGLSEAKLGEHFTVHNHAGSPCPVCNNILHRVSYESHEVVYCPHCQTGDKILADRRLSRLLK